MESKEFSVKSTLKIGNHTYSSVSTSDYTPTSGLVVEKWIKWINNYRPWVDVKLCQSNFRLLTDYTIFDPENNCCDLELMVELPPHK